MYGVFSRPDLAFLAMNIKANRLKDTSGVLHFGYRYSDRFTLCEGRRFIPYLDNEPSQDLIVTCTACLGLANEDISHI